MKGFKVAHDLAQMDSDSILVLKDSKILNDEGDDELVNLALLDKEKTTKNLELRKKRVGYNAMAGSNLLSQYDDPEPDIGFTVNIGKTLTKAPQSNDVKRMISLAYEPSKSTDYYTPDEVTFKKHKNKKLKSIRKGLDAIQPEVEEAERFSMSNVHSNLDLNFVDDDDLQKALAKSRSTVLKSRSIEQVADDALNSTEFVQQGQGLVISELSEFVDSIGNIPPSQSQKDPLVVAPDHKTAQPHIDSMESIGSMDDHEMEMDDIQENNDLEMEVGEEDEWGEIQPEPVTLQAEPLASRGLAATIALLASKGEIKRLTPEAADYDAKQKERMHWLAEQRKRDFLIDREKEADLVKKKANPMSSNDMRRRDDRDLERNKEREAREAARQDFERFKNYKPDIKIIHKDDFGRELDPKEAYKQFARKYHGTQPKKNNAEKELRKIEEEIRLKSVSSTDVNPSLQAFADHTKAQGSAYVSLAIGNRGVEPIRSTTVQPTKTKQVKAKTETVVEEPAIAPLVSAPIPTPQVQVVQTGFSAPVLLEAAPLEREKLSFGLSIGLKRKGPALFSDKTKK